MPPCTPSERRMTFVKKIIFGALFLCLLLTACAQAEPQVNLNSSSTVTTHPTTVPTNESTTKSTTVPTTQTSSIQSSVDVQGMLNFAFVKNYESYCSLLTRYCDTLPENFVTYEDLSIFGEFIYFETLQWYLDVGNIPQYSYSFMSPAGETFKITITEGITSLGADTGKQITQLRSNDLRIIDMTGITEGPAHIWINDVVYVYYSGSLRYLQWEHDGLIFELRSIPLPDTGTAWNVEGLNPAFRNLLYADTAEKAMQTFKESMEAAAVK